MILGAHVILGASDNTIHDDLPVLIVTGLKQEARIATGPGMTVVCSSSNPSQLRDLMTTVNSSSIRGIVSFGIAGGLDPKLSPGDIVVATEVVAGEKRWQTVPTMNDHLTSLLSFGRRKITAGILVGVEDIICGQTAKAALRAKTGAAAVDMESHVAAAYAEENDLPFAAVRVISDPATRALPMLVMDALKPNGKVDIWKVMRGMVVNPTTIPALVFAGYDFNRALRSLSGCRGLLLGNHRGVSLVPANL